MSTDDLQFTVADEQGDLAVTDRAHNAWFLMDALEEAEAKATIEMVEAREAKTRGDANADIKLSYATRKHHAISQSRKSLAASASRRLKAASASTLTGTPKRTSQKLRKRRNK